MISWADDIIDDPWYDDYTTQALYITNIDSTFLHDISSLIFDSIDYKDFYKRIGVVGENLYVNIYEVGSTDSIVIFDIEVAPYPLKLLKVNLDMYYLQFSGNYSFMFYFKSQVYFNLGICTNGFENKFRYKGDIFDAVPCSLYVQYNYKTYDIEKLSYHEMRNLMNTYIMQNHNLQRQGVH